MIKRRILILFILSLFLFKASFAYEGSGYLDFPSNRAFSIWLNDPYGFFGASDPTVGPHYFTGQYVDGRWASPPTVQSALMELGASQAVVSSTYLRLASPVQVVLQRPNFSNTLTINDNYTFPNNPPTDNQIMKWDAATGTLGWEADNVGGGGVSFGANNQIPSTNVAVNDFDYSATFTWDGTSLLANTLTLTTGSITDSSGAISFGNENLSTTGTLGAGAITGTSFIIGGNTLDTTEWAILDGITANKTIDHTSVTLTAGVGLSGGGDISANRSFAFDSTELDDLTWDAGTLASIVWTWSLSGASDPTLTFGNASLTLAGVFTSDGLTVGTNENLTFGTETLTFDAITSSDFELSDDLNINDTDPHLRLVDSNGDDFELWADANRVYLSNVTDTTQLLEFDENYRCFFYEASSEVAGLVRNNMIKHFTATFDPSGWYDQDATNHNVPLFTVGDDAPQGIIIDEWQCTYSTGNPTTELNANLYFADSWAWANETLIDAIDTTAGSSSEDVDNNIYGGQPIPNGKKVYVGFDADPTDATVVVIFELWYHLAN